MKRTISLWLGVLAFALLPALAQQPTQPTEPMGKVHGHITNPTGAPQNGGTISFIATSRVAAGSGAQAHDNAQGDLRH